MDPKFHRTLPVSSKKGILLKYSWHRGRSCPFPGDFISFLTQQFSCYKSQSRSMRALSRHQELEQWYQNRSICNKNCQVSARQGSHRMQGLYPLQKDKGHLTSLEWFSYR